MPSIEELPEIVPAPPPVLASITPVVLNEIGIAAATVEIAQALSTALPHATGGLPPPAYAKVVSEIIVPVAAEDVLSIVDKGSVERTEFEVSFQTAVSASLGAGNAVSPGDIVIDAVSPGSVTVVFHIDVPAEVIQAAADLFETLAATNEPIEIEFAQGTISVNPATAMKSPTVYTIPAQDCRGVWLQCTTNCTRTYKIYQIQSGAHDFLRCLELPFSLTRVINGTATYHHD
jgi:hypothetical protein